METDPRHLLYFKYVALSKQGKADKEIAAALGFDSAQRLWDTLADIGFPVCPDCGEDPSFKPTPKEVRRLITLD